MADRVTAERWLNALTHLPTAPGREQAVVEWVRAWAVRRSDLRVRSDDGGNLLITHRGRKKRDPVLAVAHMDHPAFVIESAESGVARYQFRGGVRPEYFVGAPVEFVTGPATTGRVEEHDPVSGQGVIALGRGPDPGPGDIARWEMSKGRRAAGVFSAPACDDLAGCAAALAALDRSRGRPDLANFGVLLTRAEEVGFIGAIHAARSGLIPNAARLLSIEASRASAEAPLGRGPVVRVGDASTVFDRELTNLVSRAATRASVPHQRKLMAGGSCEATAFGAHGFRATGLCLPLDNYHNMGHLDEVEHGARPARAMLESISLGDFHTLVDLLVMSVSAVDATDDLPERLDRLYDEGRHLLA